LFVWGCSIVSLSFIWLKHLLSSMFNNLNLRKNSWFSSLSESWEFTSPRGRLFEIIPGITSFWDRSTPKGTRWRRGSKYVFC
jgi:hypothetical protein